MLHIQYDLKLGAHFMGLMMAMVMATVIAMDIVLATIVHDIM